uniref:Uncharacterized protein n=1 Tax=Anopheles atroparvus TaxID=41427 RepID=A0A182JAJ8_ANOAO
MKLVIVFAVAACIVAATRAIPQGSSSTFNALSATVSSLFGQITTLVKNLGVALGKPLQPLQLAGLALPANLLPTLASLPASTLNTVNGILANALGQITTVVTGAGNDLNRLLPAIRSVQTILAATVNSLNVLNVPALSGLVATLSILSNAVSTTAS